MKNFFWRAAVGTWLAISIFAAQMTPALAGETLDAGRIHDIAAMLSAEPAGFGWPATNRAAWNKLAATEAFAKVIPDAAKLLRKNLPEQPDNLFLDYSRTGNRTRWQKVAASRRIRVEQFTLAEALENRGRFLPPLEKTIAALCAEKTWVLPAHDGNLDNFNGREIIPDLAATGLGAELAEADFILGDKLSPATRQLIHANVQRRVLTPFRNMIEDRQKEAFWVRTPMNWNAVCVGNTVFAALTLEPNRADRAFFAAAGEHCIRYFLSGFTPDGYCAEGVGYWNYGFGHFLMLTETLRQATAGKIDLLENPAAAAPALFCLHSEIFPGMFPTISDCSPGSQPSPQFTAYVCHRLGIDAGTNSLLGTYNELKMTMMFASIAENLPVAHRRETANESPLRSFFATGGVLISRTAPDAMVPAAVVIKGGHNNEPHNHNDVGSFSFILHRDMVVCDPGGEVYTKRTFSAHRYDSKVLSSFGHAVPVIAGQLQKTGADARGIIIATNFTADTDRITLDIRSAYPVSSLTKLERSFTFTRGPKPALEIRDEVAFSAPDTYETALVTWGKIKAAGTNAWEITDGQSAVRATIDTQGRPFHWRQEVINEDVQSPRKPTRLGITLEDKLAGGSITLRLTSAN